jgi:hypothetical protein
MKIRVKIDEKIGETDENTSKTNENMGGHR